MAEVLQAGDVLLLYGDMGAGKSVLCRAIAEGLGVSGPVPSPTFTLMNVYEEGRLTLYHFDLYRLEDAEALWALGLDEFIGTQGITLIEWPQKAPEAMPPRHIQCRIAYDEEQTQGRTLELTAHGGYDLAPIEAALSTLREEEQ